MGKYHPHGDSAIYDALARMAQDFSLRYPLDRRARQLRLARPQRPPGARRATPRRGSRRSRWSCSARSTRTPSTSATTYDGQHQEPIVLPARFPNLLVNGGGGIAVGMATNIPPHNLGEVIDATLHLIDNPDATVDDLMKFVQGPDFPTGALILGRSGIDDAYRTGRGSIRCARSPRSKRTRSGEPAHRRHRGAVPDVGRGDRPEDRRARERPEIEGIRDVRNESAGRHDAARHRAQARRQRAGRAQPALQAHADADDLRRRTCSRSSTACRGCSTSPTALNGVRRRTRSRSSRRRTEYRLRKAQERAHIVEGLREGARHDRRDHRADPRRRPTSTRPAPGLMAQPFEFSEIQANHILDMQLRRLAQLEGQKLRDELDELAGDDQGARVDPRRATTKLRRRHQGRARRDPRASTPTSAAPQLTHRPRRARRPRPHRGRRGRRRALAQGLRQDGRGRRSSARRVAAARACAAATSATRTTSSTCSPRPRTRTCCSSRTAAACTGCARTRSR